MARRGLLNKFPNDLDLAIIVQLQGDARKPFTAIAEELGVPESTVRKRVDRLESAGIVRFTGFADPLRLGFQYWSWISGNVDLTALRHTAHTVAHISEILFVGLTTGENNLFLAGVFRSNLDLLNFLTVRLAKIPGVIHTAASNVLQIVKRTGHLFAKPPQIAPSARSMRSNLEEEISAVDLRIIAALQPEGRKPLAKVASELGIAESTVHRRVGRLKKFGILQFEAYADPLRLGYEYWTLLSLRVDPRQASTVSAKLARFSELLFVGLTTGEHNIFAAGVFRSNEDLLTFLTNRISRLPSIRSIKTTNVLRLIKRQSAYPLSVENRARKPERHARY